MKSQATSVKLKKHSVRAKTDYIILTIAVLFGSLVGYAASQFRFFKIDTTVNVVETIVAVITIVIGLYIASSLQKRYNQNQNLYNYLITRFDTLWNDFNSLNDQVEASDKIEINRVTKMIRDFQRRNNEFKKLLDQLDSVNNNLTDLTEKYLSLFEKSLIKENIAYYDGKKELITEQGKAITAEFVAIYKCINECA